MSRWYRDPLGRFMACAGTTVLLAWIWVWEYVNGINYEWILAASLAGLCFLTVDVIMFAGYLLWEEK